MDEDASLQLNITSGGIWAKEKKTKPTRRERLKGKRKVWKSPASKESVSSKEPPVTVQKTKDDHKRLPREAGQKSNSTAGVAAKFSALFTKNPAIPDVKSVTVKPIREAVFSGNSFKDLNLHQYMVSNLEEKFGFSQMTAVQKAAIPHMLNGCDLLIKSQTGSGKTLAYAVPIVEKLQAMTPKISRASGPYAIVIVPTRELAIQSCKTFIKLTGPFNWVVPGSLMGGEKRKAEKARLRKGLNIVIAPPGRLLDHLLHTENFRVENLRWLVIDEADRLMDLGFEKDVSQIVAVLDQKAVEYRQTVLLSATLGPGVEQLAGISLRDPIHISISHGGDAKPTDQLPSSKDHVEDKTKRVLGAKDITKDTTKQMFATPESLRHQCVLIPNKLRLVTLAAFLVSKCKFSRKPCKLIAFVATQDAVEFHHHVFKTCLADSTEEDSEEEEEEEEDWLFKLHGDMPQKERTKVFQEFSEASWGALICTDVAARGLDLPAVEWIVQYHPPGTVADYIHRAGRTARAGSLGQALLFLTPAEVDYIKMLNDQKIKVDMVDMNSILKVLQGNVIRLLGGSLPRGEIPHSVQESAIALQRKMEMYVHENQEVRTLARKAYQSFIRAYTTYPSGLRHVFNLKNLHLGHVAKSFCLAETPGKIGSIVGNFVTQRRSQKNKRSDDSDEPATKRMKRNVSEYDSGFDSATVKKMAKFNQTKSKKKGKKK